MSGIGAMISSGSTRVSAAAVALALVASLTNPARATQDDGKPGRDAPGVQRTKATDGKNVTGRAAAARVPRDPTKPARWPGAEQRQVGVPDSAATPPQGKTRTAFARVGDGPVFVGDPRSDAARKTGAPGVARSRVPEQVQVRIADKQASRAAGVHGVLVAVSPAGDSTAGPVAVRMDYTDFAGAYGGDWGPRLRAVRYPACVLTTPDVRHCTMAVALPTTNDAETGLVTTVIDLSAPGPGAPAASATPASTGLAPGGRGLARSIATEGESGGVVGFTAAPAGENGDFAATPLSESSTWSAGGQSGAATWSYPIPVPQVPGSFTPQLAIGYNSQAVDGRTSGRNNQASWVGDGFDLSPGFIERKYRPCVDDQIPKDGQEPNNPDGTGGVTPTGDLCWKSDNATLSFGGSTSELIFDAAKGYWRKVFDDGTRITRENLGSGAPGNGDDNGEYWTLTTPGGVRYFFGAGEDRTGLATNSVWTVPVFGNHPATSTEPAEPGYVAGDFAASHTKQAWRWNLDFVRDLTGNAVTYVWRAETNYYNRGTTYLNPTGGTRVEYVRGGTLARVDYGLRVASVSEPPTNSEAPPAQVLFDVNERCRVPNQPSQLCQQADADAHPEWWPDVPLDQVCTAGGSCENYVPTFFGRKRLVQILTQLDPPGSAGLTAVDQFDIGYADTNELFPATLTRRAKGITSDTNPDNDTDIVLPPLSFSGEQMPNSVDGAGALALPRWRVVGVVDEAGQAVGFIYKQAECTPTNTAELNPWQNTKLCFPARYVPPDLPADQGTLRWFHKYVVTQARVSDGSGAAAAVGGSSTVVTRYDYTGAAWAYDRSPIARTENRTWNDWRGFREVATTTGDSGAGYQTQLHSTIRYYQGMYEDRADPSGGQRQKTFDVSTAQDIPDSWRFAGMPRETKVFSNPDGAEANRVSTSATIPWQFPASPPVRTPTLTGVGEARTITVLAPLTPGGPARPPRITKTAYTHDEYGQVTAVNDHADETLSTDDLCTTTTYARPALAASGPWILDRVATIRTLSDCGPSPALPAAIVNDTRNYYDGALNPTTAPTQGLLTRVDQVEVAGTGGIGEKAIRSEVSYDAYGRAISSTAPIRVGDPNPNLRVTQTAYTPSTGPVTAITVTSPDPDSGPGGGHVATTVLDPFRGLPLARTNPAGVATRASYDALGRLLKVWRDNRPSSDTPDVRYAYVINAAGPESVTTHTRLDDDRGERTITSVALYDDLRRAVQTQAPSYQEEGSPGDGRVVTATGYDTRGLPVLVSHAAFTEGAPNPGAFWAPNVTIPAQTTTTYDGVGRPITEAFTADQGPSWSTLTAYYGDRVTVTPPAGAVKTTSVTDARGRTTSMTQDPRGDGGSPRTTTYTWTPAGQMASMTDPGAANANTWTWTYDLLGRQLASNDPDAGATTKTYTPTGALSSVTDARDQVISYSYDNLDRRTARWSGPVDTGTKLAAWTYDPYVDSISRRLAGMPDTAIRYEAGQQITRQVSDYDDAARPTEHTTTIPAITGLIPDALAGEYVTGTEYNDDGSSAETRLGAFGPAFGRIEAETLRYYNDKLGRPQALTGAGAYVADVLRSPFGEVLRYSYGNTFRREAWQTLSYQPGTRRLLTSKIDREIDTTTYENLSYAYDLAGNPTSITTAGQPGAETRCFDYDGFRQLTAAWTTAGGTCGTAPDPQSNPNPALGGIAKFGYSWTFDQVGNRTSETDHRGASPATTTYTYDTTPTSGPGPHQLTGITGARTGTFDYDAIGNTKTRTIAGEAQDLTWNAEGQLQSVTTVGGSGTELARHLYDADGQRLIKRDPNGTTLYLGDSTEITLNTAGNAVTWQRHYNFDGQTVAVRHGNRMTQADILITDPQNTAQHALNTATGAVASRRTLPYGAGRDASGPTGVDPPPGWNSHRALVGAITDTATDLLRVGARDYDPLLGRFLSVDPILNLTDPLKANPYGYANNNPITYADPTGLESERTAYSNYSGSAYSGAQEQEIYDIAESNSDKLAPVGYSERTGMTTVSLPERPTDGGTKLFRGLRNAVGGIVTAVVTEPIDLVGNTVVAPFISNLPCLAPAPGARGCGSDPATIDTTGWFNDLLGSNPDSNAGRAAPFLVGGGGALRQILKHVVDRAAGRVAGGVGGDAAAAVGASRVERVVAAYGDDVLETERKVRTPYGSTDIDVVLRDNTFIEVGGPAKAINLAKFGQQLQRVRWAADQAGGRAMFRYESGTPQEAIDLAEKWFGPGGARPIG